MCKICERTWLGLHNTKWGDKHHTYGNRTRPSWKMQFHYFGKTYKDKVNRKYTYIEKETYNKRFR